MPERVLVCLSGGVDSTVATLLLKEAGHDVAAVTFWFWSFPGAPDYAGKTKCCSLDTAVLAARELGIPHEEIDASADFERVVLDDFVARYRRGETPNPCGRCNRHLRFGTALRYAADNGFDAVATGHHVRLTREADGSIAVRKGLDPNKDQTYFLYGLDPNDLARLRFPVGEMTKDEVVAIAETRGLACATLPESQDLCFALGGDASFLFPTDALAPGPILDLEGRVLGEHRGLPRYTIGQRRGLGIASDRPLFVIAIDPDRNALIVGPDEALLRSDLVACEANYLTAPPSDGQRVDIKIRYRSPAVPGIYHRISDDRFGLTFDRPQRAITPGQLAVLYDGDRLLGGGTIA